MNRLPKFHHRGDYFPFLASEFSRREAAFGPAIDDENRVRNRSNRAYVADLTLHNLGITGGFISEALS